MKVIIKQCDIGIPFYDSDYSVGYWGCSEIRQVISAWTENGNVRMDIVLHSKDGTMFPKDCDLEMEIILKATPKTPKTTTLILK
jgi:hypothetical protein